MARTSLRPRVILQEALGLKKHSLVRRIAILVIVISSCLTLVATVVQLYFDFRWSISALDEQMGQIARSYVNSLSKSIWSFDEDQTDSLLQGITTLSDIKLAEVLTGDQQYFKQGQAPDPKYRMIREYQIIYRGTNIPSAANPRLGVLRLTANLQVVYLRLFDKILLILGTNAIKMLPFSALLFFIFRFLVTRHLDAISSYMLRLNMNHLTEELVLDRPLATKKSRHPDELEVLTRSILDPSMKCVFHS